MMFPHTTHPLEKNAMTTLVTLPRILSVLVLTLPLAAVAAEPPKMAAPAATAPATAPAAAAPVAPTVAAPVASIPAQAATDDRVAIHQLEQARSQIERHHFRRARTLLHRAEAGLIKERHALPPVEQARVDGAVTAIKASVTALHHRNHRGALSHLDQALAQVRQAPARS